MEQQANSSEKNNQIEQKKIGKKIKLKQPKRSVKKAYKSCQSEIKIKEIYDGMVVLEDASSFERYVTILEVEPMTFSLKTPRQQNDITYAFQGVFNILPKSSQFIVMNIPASLKVQLDDLDEHMSIEKNESCLKVDEAYKEKLLSVQETSTAKRFFIVYEYDGKKEELDVIAGRMRQIEMQIRNILHNCGNEVLRNPNDFLIRNEQTLEILYTFFNRNEIVEKPFEAREQEVLERYYNYYGTDQAFISPNDYYAPETMSYLNSKYIVVNAKPQEEKQGTYYSFLYIPAKHYMSNVAPNWVNYMIPSMRGVDVSVFFEKVERSEIIGKIRRNLTYTESNYATAANNSIVSDTSNKMYESGYYIKECLDSSQDFFYMSTLITVSDTSPEGVDQKVETIKTALKSYYVKVRECRYLEEKCFNSALPFCNLDKDIYAKAKRNIMTEGAAKVYMFDDSTINDKNGIYFGDNLDTGSLVNVDVFNNEKYPNPNVFICGTSGAGKTFSLSLMAIRMRMKHMPVYIIAPEKQEEFIRVCHAMGGQFIELGSSSNSRINVFDIYKRDKADDKDLLGVTLEKSLLADKVDSLMRFFKLVVKDISLEEEADLKEAIMTVYDQKGITLDNDSLIDPEDFMRQRFKKMPIIADLVAVLKQRDSTQRLARIINAQLVISSQTYNGQTNVDLNNEFTVFGLETLKDDMIPVGVFMTMDYIWSKIKENKRKHKALFMDEWWKLAQNPISADYSMQIAKTIRAFGGSMVLATQQMNDILSFGNGDLGSKVLGNCSTKIILRMDSNDADAVKELTGINDTEVTKIKMSSVGEALFISGQSNCRMKFEASPYEKKLISTSVNDLDEVAKENIAKRKKEEGVLDFNDLIIMNNDDEDDEVTALTADDILRRMHD